MISVVIPLYNKAAHIQRALDSVLAQSCTDCEVIVVNDGSTDGSEKIVERYTDPRIRLIHREHVNSAGGHAARNRGIAEARADLIAFMDADDEWLPEHLETILRLRGRHPQCGAYSTAFRVVTPRGKEVISYAGIPDPPFEGVIPNYFRTVHGDHAICSSSVGVPKAVFDVCGCFPEGEPRRGDLDMWCRIALKYPIAFSTYVGAVYRRDADNRIRNGRPVLAEPRIVRTLESALVTGDFPDSVARADLLEYMSMQLVSRAQSMAFHGHLSEARGLLRKAASTRVYRGVYRRWVLLSRLPMPLFRFVLRVMRWMGAVRCGARRIVGHREVA